jgi:hypothetical protein
VTTRAIPLFHHSLPFSQAKKMNGSNRRRFLADVGRSMLVASVGSATAFDLGLFPAFADESDKRVTFGKLEPLVSLMQETLPDKLLPLLAQQIKAGTSLKQLVTAGALANVRAFAGQDYTGYHTFMALIPALQMAAQLPDQQQALPVMKVLYRNSSRILEQSANHDDALHPVEPLAAEIADDGTILRDEVRAVNWDGAESRFARIATGPAGEAFNHLQFSIQDEINVHRVVLSWRAWSMLDLAGNEYAHALLRQSVRFCLDSETYIRDKKHAPSQIRELLPRLLDEHKLLSKPLGQRQAEDAWVEELASVVFSASREQAASAVAQALSEGFDPEAIGEAISLAANKLVLHDPGRSKANSSAQKPPGCVHGDSVGVHASDAANAWRNIARVTNPRNQIASLIVGAFHTAGQTGQVTSEPYAYDQHLDELQKVGEDRLLQEVEAAIRANEQARACAVAERYRQLKLAEQPLFDLLLKYAVSEDGALHAEKYYCTAREEFGHTREAFRWRQLIALARVTASEYGFTAPGYEESRGLLGIG